MKKILCLGLCVATVFALAACGGKGKGADGSSAGAETKTGLDTSKLVKIGVLVADDTTAEALAFRSYYTDYIQSQYNVEFVYSDKLEDAAAEKSAIDTMITNNCKAIISFASADRPAQIEQCEAAGIYYAVATGTLTDEEYEKYKGYEHYVGAIGPSLDVEYQAGYDMAKYYLDQGKKNFAIFGGTVAYHNDMHVYRVAGMLAAMTDTTGAQYEGVSGPAIIGKIHEQGGVTTGSIGDVNILGYLQGYDMDDAWFGKGAEIANTPGLEVFLCVGNGSDFFGAMKPAGVELASVDAYAEQYGQAMAAGTLNYMAGKFSASIGPIFIATYRAALGSPVRDTDGNALALAQGYWVATSADEFNEYYSVDSSKDAPAYDKAKLDTLLDADYNAFADFVSKYSFDEIQSL